MPEGYTERAGKVDSPGILLVSGKHCIYFTTWNNQCLICMPTSYKCYQV